jgi:hypothetical protein
MAKQKAVAASEGFEERAREYLRVHGRIVSDFERSLKNARHFIKLAERSLEQEPEATVTLLEQIREIDLLRHVSHQLEDYESVLALLPAELVQGTPTQADEGQTLELKAMRARYEALLQEAEAQAEEMGKLLNALTQPH